MKELNVEKSEKYTEPYLVLGHILSRTGFCCGITLMMENMSRFKSRFRGCIYTSKDDGAGEIYYMV
jgi:hypothetical protein